MSLKTAPYKPANHAEDMPMEVLNLTEMVDFIYPDGTSRALRMFEAVYLCAMYTRRGAHCAIYAAGTRNLILEFIDGQLRATPALFEAVKALLSVLKAECDDAVSKASIAHESKAGTYGGVGESGDEGHTQVPGARAEAQEAPAQAAAAANDPPEPAAPADDARGTNRFRRGRR